MNFKDKMDRLNRIKENKYRVDINDNIHVNCVRPRSNETLEHFLCKAYYCYQLHKLKIPFITEAHIKMSKGLRVVDIYELDTGKTTEVETGKSYLKEETANTIMTKDILPKIKEQLK